MHAGCWRKTRDGPPRLGAQDQAPSSTWTNCRPWSAVPIWTPSSRTPWTQSSSPRRKCGPCLGMCYLRAILCLSGICKACLFRATRCLSGVCKACLRMSYFGAIHCLSGIRKACLSLSYLGPICCLSGTCKPCFAVF